MPRTIATVLVVALLGLACGGPTPSATSSPTPSPTGTGLVASPTPSPTPSSGVLEIDPAQLVGSGGCGDVFVWAVNANGTAAITIQWDGAARAAWAAGGFQESAQLPHAEVKVAVDEGKGLDHFYCNDLREPGQGTTSSTPAASGTVELIVRPDAQGFQPASHADVRLSDVTFHVTVGGEDQVWHLAELVVENVSVGWLAG